MAGRTSQVAAEPVYLPDERKGRVSQVAGEPVYLPANRTGRVSLVAAEVLYIVGAAPAPSRPLGRSYVIG